MYLERHFKNTIKQIQSISETARVKNGTISLPRIKQIGLGPVPKTCQFIEAAPTRMELRRYGADSFKCGKPNDPGKVYCQDHFKRCYLVITDKETAE